MLLKPLLPLLVCSAFSAAAQEPPGFAIVAHGISWHNHNYAGDGTPYNERNPGLGLRLTVAPDTSVQAGRYRNSFSTQAQPRWSNYVVADWLPAIVVGANVGLFAGLVNGYPTINDGRPIPVAGAVVRAHFGRFNLTLRASPSKDSHSVAALEIGYQL